MKPSSIFHLQRSLIHIGFFLGALIISMIAIAKSNYPMLAGLILVLFLPTLIQSPSWLLILVIALFGTEATLPMLPASLSLHLALAAVLSLWLIVRNLILHSGTPVPQPSYAASNLFLFLYLVTLVLIMSVRGTGMRAFGSAEWGGGKYFLIFIASAFCWTAPLKGLGPRQWKWAVLLLTAGYVLPFVAQWLLSFSGGYFDITDYIRPALTESGATSLEGVDVQTSLIRVYPLAALGTAIGIAALMLLPVRMPQLLAIGLFLLVGLALVGLSGYRSHFLALAGAITFYSFVFRENRSWVRHLFILLLIAITLWSLLFLITPYLPALVQRTLSIIPGLGVAETVQTDATNTITWRFSLWRFSLLLGEQYRWLGRGFLFSPDELPQFDYTTDMLYMYLRHNYHNGPLSLLIDTGIPGLVFCSGLFLSALVESRRLLGEIPSHTPFGRAYRVLFAYLVMQVLYFYLIIGDPVAAVTRILFTFTLMKVLVTSWRTPQAPAAPVAAAQGSRPF
jgi:hypothetical protein